MRSARYLTAVCLGLLVATGLLGAAHDPALELAPTGTQLLPGGERIGEFSPRTLVVGVEIDRDQARILRYTVKSRPYTQALELPPVRVHGESGPVQVEVTLLGPGGQRLVKRVDVRSLCLSHGGEAVSYTHLRSPETNDLISYGVVWE